mgnify:CR=1 FL=1
MQSNTSHSSLRRFGWCFVLFLVGCGLSGCAATLTTDRDFDGWTISRDKIRTFGSLNFLNRNYGYKVVAGEHKIQIKTYGRIRFDKGPNCNREIWACHGPDRFPRTANTLCHQSFGAPLKTVLSRPEPTWWGPWNDYPQIIEVSCYEPEQYNEERVQARQQQEEARRRQQALENQRQGQIVEARKDNCTSYGFTSGSDAHAQCVMQLAIAEEAQAASSAEAARLQSAIRAQQAAQAAAAREAAESARRQREAQALIGLGNVISGAGTPRSTAPITNLPSYGNSYSSTLTVPSNQLCPILSTRVTKQEVRGANRVCYYQ